MEHVAVSVESVAETAVQSKLVLVLIPEVSGVTVEVPAGGDRGPLGRHERVDETGEVVRIEHLGVVDGGGVCHLDEFFQSGPGAISYPGLVGPLGVRGSLVGSVQNGGAFVGKEYLGFVTHAYEYVGKSP